MLTKTKIPFEDTVLLLKATAEHTRLRLLLLLVQSDLTVSELMEILGQSQPRISRHLRLLVEAGLAERYQEGAWAVFRTKDRGQKAKLLRALLDQVDIEDDVLIKDRERLQGVKDRQAQRAAEYFAKNAASWDELRSHHVPDDKVEAEILNLIGDATIDNFLDIGTGTGRMLEVLEGHYKRGVGIDISHEMMAIARANLERVGIKHAQIRHGDVLHLPVEKQSCDLVIIHQVLHFLDDPARVIGEASKVLSPQGKLLIVDFAPHDLEELRDHYAHLRLGFSHEQMADWLEKAGLQATAVKDLSPEQGAKHSLTVSLWLAAEKQ